MTRFLGALLLAFAPHLAPAQDAVPPEDARAVRAVIEAQLDAFGRDDAARAFSLATPGIRVSPHDPVHLDRMDSRRLRPARSACRRYALFAGNHRASISRVRRKTSPGDR